MKIIDFDTFERFGIKMEKKRKIYNSTEFTDYVVYKIKGKKLRNFFVGRYDTAALRIAAQIRALKLMERGNFSPVISYHPERVKEFVASELLPVETQDGEHIIGLTERFEKWILSESENGHVLLKNGKLSFVNTFVDDQVLSRFFTIYKLPWTPFELPKESVVKPPNLLPVHSKLGFLSKRREDLFSFNSLFFTMEITDMKSTYTCFGQPYGLTINDGKIMTPPLFKRGTFFMDCEGNVQVRSFSVEDVEFFIGEVRLIPSKNCEIWRRPRASRTSMSLGDVDIVVINDHVVSFKENGETEIPDAGFVVRIDKKTFEKIENWNISYPKYKKITFALQGGPLILKEGLLYDDFMDEEFGGDIPYPPTVFPFDWDKTPAARLAIGNEKDNVVILAAEGCNNYTYEPGFDSRGFTLEEMGNIMKKEGVENAVNLDGGGSMQIRLLGAKALKYADRRGISYHEFERPVPVGVFIKKI